MAEKDIIIEGIKSLREKKGWTPYRLAKKAGIAFNTLKDIEKGDSSPTVGVLRKLCEAMDATVCDAEIEGAARRGAKEREEKP